MSMVPSESSLAQASDRCPEEEWSRWYPAADGLQFTYKICMRGNRQEFEWNWGNFSNSGVSIAYRIFTRNVNNCTAPLREAIGSGLLTVPPNTRLDVPGGGSAGPSQYGRVHLCISRDWQFAFQTAIDSLDVGTRIRVSRISVPGEPIAGSVSSVGPNAVLVTESPSDSNTAASERWMRFEDISELAVSRGIRNRAVFGLSAGALVGGLGGALVGWATAGYECEWMPVYDEQIRQYAPTRVCTGPLPGTRAAIVGVVSSIVGGAVGYLVGSRFLSESWTTAGPTWTLVRF
jgi:hypothetical protein